MIVVILIGLAGLVAAALLVKSIAFTPAVKGGLAELVKLRIGDVDQWLSIRGEDAVHPILLYLHSGPGSTEMIPFRLFHRNLEKHFTVVVWEQRGTGKSVSPSLPSDSMTIDRFVADGRDVAGYLLRRFGKEKILVVGHSWGSALGIRLVQAHPELFYAYVGSGQVVRPAEGERIGYHFVMEQAKGNPKALAELTCLDEGEGYLTIDPQGLWYDRLILERKWLVALGGEIRGRSDYSLFFNFQTILAPEYTWVDFINFARGSVFSLKAMWPEIMALDFPRDAARLSVPVFFFQGRHDQNTPAVLVEEYFDRLSAPANEIVWFEDSGHHPMYEEPEKYERCLIEKVLPLCQ